LGGPAVLGFSRGGQLFHRQHHPLRLRGNGTLLGCGQLAQPRKGFNPAERKAVHQHPHRQRHQSLQDRRLVGRFLG
jgi:hypothetical protein